MPDTAAEFFIFTPKFGEDEPIFLRIFFRWVETFHHLEMYFLPQNGTEPHQ